MVRVNNFESFERVVHKSFVISVKSESVTPCMNLITHISLKIHDKVINRFLLFPVICKN